MAFGIWKDNLIVLMDRDRAGKSLQYRHVKPFDITGRPMAGWVMVQEAGWKSAAGLEKWINIGKAYARSLPEKTAKTRKRKSLKDYQG